MSEQEALAIRFKLTADDYAGFNRYHGRRQLAFLFLFYVILFVVAAEWRQGFQNANRLAIVIPAGIVLGGLMVGFHLWAMQGKTRKIFESDPLALQEQSIVISDTGIRHATGETTMNMPWPDVRKAVETSKAIILYVARNKAILIPQREVSDWPQLKQMLRRHLPAAKLRLKG